MKLRLVEILTGADFFWYLRSGTAFPVASTQVWAFWLSCRLVCWLEVNRLSVRECGGISIGSSLVEILFLGCDIPESLIRPWIPVSFRVSETSSTILIREVPSPTKA